MQLRPFDANVTCPGCGAPPSTAVRPQLRYCVGVCSVIDLGGIIEQAGGRGQRHLHWICGRCAYEDLMACAPPARALERERVAARGPR